MKTIKHILARYTAYLWALLKPLGIWGVFVIAAADGSFLGLPMDAVVAGYVYQDHARFWLYAILAAAGSAVGSSVLYVIGYAGGEALLRKRIPPARFEKIKRSFDEHEFWALMFPAMLPPPTPFKLFVLAAAGFEMNYAHFVLAIFLGRLARFLLLSLLTIRYGKQVVEVLATLFRTHLHWVLGIGGAAIGVWLMLHLRGRRRKAKNV
ncbi:MAG TPA: VTT domain-containing protein [Terriglobales bacterium]|nr:VTT domain-containing protein [Terriglobales bacterium]